VPYKIEGNVVYHKKGGKWSVKQRCSSSANAKKALKLLYGVERGWKPTGKVAKPGK